MTRPIPEGAPRKRPARSCLACRSSKVRCVGALVAVEVGAAESRCQRCEKMDIDCEFVSLRRFGRPRRRPPGTAPNDRRTGEKSKGKEKEVPNDGWVDADVPPSQGRAPPSAPHAGTLVPSPRSSLSPPASPTYYSFPLPSPHQDLAPASDTSDNYESLAHEYLTTIHPFLPLLPSTRDHLVSYLRFSAPILSIALYSILNPNADLHISVESYQTSLADLQAAVMIVQSYYGRGKPAEARETLQWVCARILEKGWHRIDAAGHEGMDIEFVKGVRVLWWESWCMEILLAIVTGVRTFVLQGVDYSVLVSDSPNDADSPYSLRVRAVSLLLSSTEPPSPAELDPTPRIEALNTVASTLSLLSRHSYLTTCNLLASLPSSHASYASLSASREAAFMASLISSASTIFLLSSSSLFASFAASAFPCGLDTTSTPPISTHAILRIASSHIFSLIRTSLNPAVPPSVHSPFFGCSLLVASQGAMLTLQAGESDDWRGAGVLSDLELAEWVLAGQERRWSAVGGVLRELRMLRLAVYGASERGAQLLLSSVE